MSRNTKMHTKAFSTHEMVFKRKLSYVSAAVLCEAEDSYGMRSDWSHLRLTPDSRRSHIILFPKRFFTMTPSLLRMTFPPARSSACLASGTTEQKP